MQQNRHPIDWALFAALTVLWASAYAFTRLAVSHDDPALGFPPQFIIPLRITAGAIVLLIVAALTRQSWPPLSDWKSWLIMAAMGTLGTATPFLLITTAQKTVDSSLAALYVSAAPLFTSVLAHFAFHDDFIDRRKIMGLVIGFVGVAVLFGPEALASFGSASVIAQAMCLLATFFYASSSIIARYGKTIPPFVFSAGFLVFGAFATWPLLFLVEYETLTPSTGAIAGIVGLAIGPTAIASVVYMILIQRTSASFVSLTGYVIPILSAIIGFFAFREMQSWNAFLAFALILGGVWLAQRQPARAPG
nr:DMT family transporter [Hyphomonas sp. Mor2]